jgi:hypothetical protein
MSPQGQSRLDDESLVDRNLPPGRTARAFQQAPHRCRRRRETGEAFTSLGTTSIRYIAFKPEGSTVKYEVNYNGVPLADAEARFTQLGAEGYVVTTGEAFTSLGTTSIRYIAFKALSLP